MPWQCWPARWALRRWRPARSSAPATTPTKWCRAMRRPVVLPEMGAAPAVLSIWFVRPGDPVFAGDRLVEVLVEGATFDVSSPATGVLAEQLALPDDPLEP